MWPAGAVSSTMFLLLALVGCGSNGVGGATIEPSGEGRIGLHNESSREAWYAYTRRCGDRDWGEDELGPRLVVRPGQSAEWVETAGCYDLLVLTNPRVAPRYEARYERRQVLADEETAVAIADIDWSPGADVDPSPSGPMP